MVLLGKVSRGHHLYGIQSDWLSVRVRVDLIGLDSGVDSCIRPVHTQGVSTIFSK